MSKLNPMQLMLRILLLFAVLVTAAHLPAFAQKQKAQPKPPKEERPVERKVLRFLTSTDFPPFNYYDEEGNLSGFNIDLANAICSTMSVVCDIRVKPWDELTQTFKLGDVDGIIAGLAVTKKNLNTLDFTNAYMRMPARFVILKSRPQPTPSKKNLWGRKVGVLRGTAHAAYLYRFFNKAKIVTFKSQTAANTALQEGKIDYLFGDAIQMMFWLNGSLSKQCCQFLGNSFWDPYYFGEGLAIAIPKGNIKLRIELNEAIDKLRLSGEFEELTLRYFPLAIY